MRACWVLGLSFACSSIDAHREALRASAPPLPVRLSPLVAGRSFVAEVEGLAPGAPVWLARGTGPGAGPCPPALGGACVGLRAPAVMGGAVADADGVVMIRARAPAELPPGTGLWVQVLTPGQASAPARVEVQSVRWADLSTGFDAPEELDPWAVLSEVDGTATVHDRVEVDAGALVIDPNDWLEPGLADGAQGPGWYQDRKGPFVFQEVEGDFVVRARVRVGTVADVDARPTGTFNAGGLVIRDPASSDPVRQPDLGDERWVMYNVGQQAGAPATELKTTFEDDIDADAESNSSIFLRPTPSLSGWLVACREGTRLRFWRRMEGEAAFTEEIPQAATLWSNNAGLSGPDFLAEGFDRPDLPDRVQVGLIANRWTDGPGAPVRVAVDEVWLGEPNGDCLRGAVAP